MILEIRDEGGKKNQEIMGGGLNKGRCRMFLVKLSIFQSQDKIRSYCKETEQKALLSQKVLLQERDSAL